MSFLTRAALFLLLSLTDLSLTWLLLSVGGGAIDEGNPVARWLLTGYGWTGLAAFKGLTVLVVLGVCGLLHVCRPRLADRLLVASIAVVGAVVLYSCLLTSHLAIAYQRFTNEWAGQEPVAAADEPGSAEEDLIMLIREQRRELVASLLAGRCSLARAVQDLDCVVLDTPCRWREELEQQYPSQTQVERLALVLVQDATHELQKEPAGASRTARRLLAELHVYADAGYTPQALHELAWGKDWHFSRFKSRPGGSSSRLLAGDPGWVTLP